MEKIDIEPTTSVEDAVKKVLERAKLINQRVIADFNGFIINSKYGYDTNIDLYFAYMGEPKNGINWEQRRYEIARSAMVGLMAGHNAIYEAKKLASVAMKYTDALIEELKKPSTRVCPMFKPKETRQ